jgi:hypothetical protein
MMRLTWKDGAATVLTAGVVTLYVAFLAGAGLPLLSAPRVLAGLVLVMGLGACALGGSGAATDGSPRWVAYTGGILGGAAFLAAVVTLITGNAAVLGVLIGATIALWFFATARHAFTGVGRARIDDRDLHRLVERAPAAHRHS